MMMDFKITIIYHKKKKKRINNYYIYLFLSINNEWGHFCNFNLKLGMRVARKG